MDEEIIIPTTSETLRGIVYLPDGARGIVLFAHGSGSGRHSPRNQFVAKKLQEKKIATLLMDLLTEEEEAIDARTLHLRFDIELLAGRLIDVTDWVREQERMQSLHIGYFGASTGAAAALVAAAERTDLIKAVVSRGGRPDLAAPVLDAVRAPTLLIVGGDDKAVIELNKKALALLECEKQLEIVPGATHLFEEPGTLEQAAKLASAWFQAHF